MTIFLEEPSRVAFGTHPTDDGSPPRRCPNGFTSSNSCPCYLDPTRAPDRENCHSWLLGLAPTGRDALLPH